MHTSNAAEHLEPNARLHSAPDTHSVILEKYHLSISEMLPTYPTGENRRWTEREKSDTQAALQPPIIINLNN